MLNRNRCQKQAAGFTITELLIVIFIIALLAAITIPVAGVAQNKSRATVCAVNVRSHAQAYAIYSGDHDSKGIWVDHSVEYAWPDWHTALKPYFRVRAGLRCPLVSEQEYYHFCREANSDAYPYTGYAMNMVLAQQFDVPDPTKIILFGEVQAREVQEPGRTFRVNRALIHTIDELHCRADLYPRPLNFCDSLPHGHNRHLGGSNIALLDGHVRWVKRPHYRLYFFTGVQGVYRYEGPVDGPRFHLEETQ